MLEPDLFGCLGQYSKEKEICWPIYLDRKKETAHTKETHLGKEIRSKLLIAFAFALHLSFSGQRHQV
jgi:hypothetical protein